MARDGPADSTVRSPERPSVGFYILTMSRMHFYFHWLCGNLMLSHRRWRRQELQWEARLWWNIISNHQHEWMQPWSQLIILKWGHVSLCINTKFVALNVEMKSLWGGLVFLQQKQHVEIIKTMNKGISVFFFFDIKVSFVYSFYEFKKDMWFTIRNYGEKKYGAYPGRIISKSAVSFQILMHQGHLPYNISVQGLTSKLYRSLTSLSTNTVKKIPSCYRAWLKIIPAS